VSLKHDKAELGVDIDGDAIGPDQREPSPVQDCDPSAGRRNVAVDPEPARGVPAVLIEGPHRLGCASSGGDAGEIPPSGAVGRRTQRAWAVP
jgi:hypothetical protein